MKVASLLLLVAALASPALAQTEDKVVTASDKRSQIRVPKSWGPLQLNDAAEIQVGSEEDDSYIIVLEELKEDLDGWNLDKHSRVTLGKLLAGLADPIITGPKSMTVDGHPALQYEIRAASNGHKVIYLHTTVDGETMFSQILAWTVPSKADTMKPLLVKAIGTFHETKPSS